MPSIVLDEVSFSYPVYEMTGRSLKLAFVRSAVGASISKEPGVIHVDALRNISLEFKAGDRVGLIGHNGAGKSSLLRLMAGLAHPSSGKVTIEGRLIPLIEKGLGINNELSGHDNIELPLRLLGASSAEIAEAKRDIPVWTGLGNFMNLPVRTYSEGMRTRLMFALSTAILGDILLLDEWLGAGDASFVEQAEVRLANYVARAGIVVLASHSLDLISRVCNKAVWMESGRVLAFGSADDVIGKYLGTVIGTAAE